jgi:hypothetical protein
MVSGGMIYMPSLMTIRIILRVLPPQRGYGVGTTDERGFMMYVMEMASGGMIHTYQVS